MSNYDNYNQARLLWLEAEKEYTKCAVTFNRLNEDRISRYKRLQLLAAELSEEDKAKAVKEQFG